MLLILIVCLFVLCVTFAPSWRAAGKLTLGFVFLALCYWFSWVVTPFSSESWSQASLFKRRLLARNFLNTHDYQALNHQSIEKLFGEAHLRDNWTYFVEIPGAEKSLDGLLIAFDKGHVSDTGTLWGSHPLPSVSGAREFEMSDWKNADSVVRASMVADLLIRKVLLQKSKEEVLSILGPPDRWTELSYDLGMFPWFGEIDGYSLVFEVDAGDKVVEADIHQN